MADDLGAMTLTECVSAVRGRRLSPVELVESCIARIRRDDHGTNAFLAVDAEGALASAHAAMLALDRGIEVGPLHGVPLAHKDIFWRKGGRITGGSRILPEVVGSTTATVLERMDAAGAVHVGALNMSEFAVGASGHNIHYGDCRNPWNPAHAPGGSSSGSGAAVASRLVPGALGSDTGGSVRIPAAFCGLYGLRPTYGAVSRHGVMPRAWSLDTVGPLCRTASDCALLFSVVAGRDAKDPSTAAAPLPGSYPSAPDARQAGALRIGIEHSLLQSAELDPEVAAALETAVGVLTKVTSETRSVSLPEFRTLFHLADIVPRAEAATMHAKWMRSRPHDYDPSILSRLEPGLYLPATEYLEAMSLRGRWLARYLQEVFSAVDVVFLPGPGMVAPPLSDEEFSHVARMTGTVRPMGYLGLPALSVPCGFSRAGLPIGFQIAARPFAEATLFNLAAAYERETDWTSLSPAVHSD